MSLFTGRIFATVYHVLVDPTFSTRGWPGIVNYVKLNIYMSDFKSLFNRKLNEDIKVNSIEARF